MKTMTRRHENNDENGYSPEQTVMVSVTSLSYQTDTTGGGHAADLV
ncbi:hypothetical protein [Mesorhizobium sp. B2-6-4]|nr:hypothetical protein [Mesorhizobium sp. B2-6-4]